MNDARIPENFIYEKEYGRKYMFWNILPVLCRSLIFKHLLVFQIGDFNHRIVKIEQKNFK